MKWCVSLVFLLTALLTPLAVNGVEEKSSPAPEASPEPQAKGKAAESATPNDPKKDQKQKSKEKGTSKGKDKSKDGDDDKSDKKKKKKKKKGEIVIPIEKGKQATGISLPIFDDKGNIQMKFSIETAEKLDNDRLQMKNVEIETFADDGSTESHISTENSILNLETKIVTSDTPVTVRRSDFEVTGDTMVFDTKTRSGKFIGNTHMFIYKSPESTTAASSNE